MLCSEALEAVSVGGWLKELISQQERWNDDMTDAV
jgi:hypothetical protein